MFTRRRGRPACPDLLTPTEWQVLDAVRHGMSRREIAVRRGRSIAAVDYHLENIRDKLGVERTAELRRWQGYPASSPLSRRIDAPMEDELQLGPIGQISLLSRDSVRSEAFFRDALGLPHLYTFGDLVFFDCDGLRLYIRQVRGDEQWRPSSTIYFEVGDIRSAHATLIERGVVFRQAPHMIHRHDSGIEEWMAFFDDPDGNLIALMSKVAPHDDEPRPPGGRA
jgi:DNA-binding CsgD family transcriptional regulator/catechol 2,3-dioxygenase-like lactoylglutathione lyase family enzyme